MMSAWEYFSGPTVQCWSIVLLHFVWQGFVIAGFTSLALRLLGAVDASHRYTVTLIGLLFMVAVPASTFFLVNPPVISREFKPERLATTLPAAFQFDASAAQAPAESLDLITETELSSTTARTDFQETHWFVIRAVLFAIWFGAQAILMARLFLGAVSIWRIRRASEQVSDEITEIARRLAKRLRLGRVPEILSSRFIGDAAACGFFRAVVLLPSAWLTQMSPEMIEAILAHELSHIRRHDAWVNLMQRLVESAFFYHPAVWWLSQKIRIEREHRSDADAVRITGKGSVLARALEHAARQAVGVRLELVSNLGDDRMSLLNRVNRVLNNHCVPSSGNRWQLGLLALLVPLLMFFSSPKPVSHAEEENPTVAQEQTPSRHHSAGASQESQIAEAPAVDVAQIPTESNKVRLPAYVVEPPDILLIDTLRLVPKRTYELAPSDVLHITGPSGKGPFARRITGDYTITSKGAIDLRSPHGSVTVAGLSVIEAKHEIDKRLATMGKDITVSVSLAEVGDRLSGEFLVGPDGELGLGRYGRVQVSGKTILHASHAIEKQLSKYFDKPEVFLDVLAFNSKVFYVILENEGTLGDSVARMPVTGNETVLDAIAQTAGLDSVGTKSIWICRPNPKGGGQGRILPVSWEDITRGASTDTNYQLLPGDRLFVSARRDGAASQEKQVDQVAETDLESAVRHFNRLVKSRQFKEAIRCTRQLVATEGNRPIVEALRLHASLIELSIACKASAESQEVAEVLGELRESRLADIEVRRALRRKMVVKFDETPLAQALETVAKRLEVNLAIDSERLATEGVLRSTPVSLDLRQPISVKTVLQLFLEPLHLKYQIQDGVIRITGEQATSPFITKVYNVSDLVGLPMTMHSDKTLDYDELISLIATTVAPESWSQAGGLGDIASFLTNKSLVVSNSQNVHDEVKELLQQLRNLVKQQANAVRR